MRAVLRRAPGRRATPSRRRRRRSRWATCASTPSATRWSIRGEPVQPAAQGVRAARAAARERRPGAHPRHPHRPGVGRRLRRRHQDARRPRQAAAGQGRGRPVATRPASSPSAASATSTNSPASASSPRTNVGWQRAPERPFLPGVGALSGAGAGAAAAAGAAGGVAGGGFVQGEVELVRQRRQPHEDVAELVELCVLVALADGLGQLTELLGQATPRSSRARGRGRFRRRCLPSTAGSR